MSKWALQLIFLFMKKFNSEFQTCFNMRESWIFRNLYSVLRVLSSAWTHHEAGASCSKLISLPTTVLTIVASCANCVCATTKQRHNSIVEGQSMSICRVENSKLLGQHFHMKLTKTQNLLTCRNVNKTLNPKTLWTEMHT
jgi:hypothetical protein